MSIPGTLTPGALTLVPGAPKAAAMSALDDAIASLERAVARLEAVADPTRRDAEERRTAALAAAVAQRVDAALAKLEQLLETEE